MTRKAAMMIGLAVTLAIYYFAVMPLEAGRPAMQAELRAEHATLLKYRRFLETVKDGDEQLREARSRVEQLERGMVPASDISLAMATLQGRAQDKVQAAGLKILSIKSQPAEDGGAGGYRRLPIFIDCTGDASELSRLLKSLDTPDVMISLDSISISMLRTDMMRIKLNLSGLMRQK